MFFTFCPSREGKLYKQATSHHTHNAQPGRMIMEQESSKNGYVKNAADRLIPRELNGRSLRPFQEASTSALRENLTKAAVRVRETMKGKFLSSIDEAIERTGLSDGMTVSFHHHLRLGDRVINMVLDRIAQNGIRDIRLAQSALFDVHNPLIDHINNGVVTRIEGSINGPVGLRSPREN